MNNTNKTKRQLPCRCKAVKQAEFGAKIVPVEHGTTGTFLGLAQLSKRIYDMSILSDGFQPCGGVNHESQGLRSYRNPSRDPSPHRPNPSVKHSMIYPKLSD